MLLLTEHLHGSMMDSLFTVLDWRAGFTTHFCAVLSTIILNFNSHMKLVAEPSDSAAAFPNVAGGQGSVHAPPPSPLGK